ncbi:MAG: diguanylate cyclase [Sulfurimonas sp.]|nr:diguanylate cyclase [Sulfurimonas sp.]
MLEGVVKLLENKIKLNNSFLEMLFDAIPNPIFYKDKDGIYQNCNEAFSKTILGIPKNAIIGKTLYDFPELIPKENADIYYEKDLELMNKRGTQFYESTVKCSDSVSRHYNFYKATFISESNEVLGIVGIMLDISEHKKVLKELDEKNARLNALSITYPLTELYNRRYFEDIFNKQLSRLDRNKQKFAFMMIDIDFFKDYNDSFGHLQGDEILKKISKVLKESFLRPTDYVFRLGGEEFGILYNYANLDHALNSAQKLIKKVEELKIESANKTVSDFITISVGLVVIEYLDYQHLNTKELYGKVDKLLYKSKNSGRNKLSYEIISQ